MLFQSHEQCLKNVSKNRRMEPNSNHLVPLDPKMHPLAAGTPQALLNLLATIPVTRYVEIVTTASISKDLDYKWQKTTYIINLSTSSGLIG